MTGNCFRVTKADMKTKRIGRPTRSATASDVIVTLRMTSAEHEKLQGAAAGVRSEPSEKS